MSWFPPTAGVRAGTRLFCLPHGGSGASAYQPWQPLVPDGVGLVPVRLPGRENRFAEPPARTVEEVVDALTGPLLARAGDRFALFGHSLGGLLAYELARATTRAGRPPVLLAVSGCPAPQLLPRAGAPLVHLMTDGDLLAHVRAIAGTAASALDVPELAGLIVPVLRADYEVYETYRHRRGERLPVPVIVLAGEDDPEVSTTELSAWRELCTRTPEFHTFPGGHFYLSDHPEVAVDAVLSGLRGTG
ncbi:hypothetical protein BLA60_04410 [Actinophytocola xinjiangensis]|uniref:Thioesterase domain-containing protein n=1 Tax=Actinophytocola xinjiangensis TaxID=485602 RepID=A0A7Z0WS75_9PSEU|nr:alpha/beta fold hydrolase [Actinophytocola xinjiangensis]OLF14375.1 hypothetical protein BLA60_04410 [Actinophytocola xinjiangensis]